MNSKGHTDVENVNKRTSATATISEHFLKFSHSYGYDCQRYFNFCVVDPNTIIFASGNLIHIFNVPERTLSFRRGSTNRGFGHVTKNPVYPHIAVGENGPDSPIIIYEWPSWTVVSILRGGSTKTYSHLAYSPSGDLLVSQGGKPDFIITVWNWRETVILLKCQSHHQDIYNIIFSPTIAGHFVTSGVGHVKFWQMAKTFTGLKLQGQLGRFGKTKVTDIIGVYLMPDGKIVSGCEWGNILVWHEGLIRLEVRRKNKQPCHEKLITQFIYNNNELITIGMDGWIRVWYFDTIDQADPPEDNRFIEVEPIYEFQVAENFETNMESSMLMGLLAKDPNHTDMHLWYAQDANGGLWLIDLNTTTSPSHAEKLLSCHAGPIADIAAATWDDYLASLGKDGRLYVYWNKKIIIQHKFNEPGCKIIWLPCSVEPTGSTLICAFESGVLRVVAIGITQINVPNSQKIDLVRLIQVLKPHTRKILVMSLNPSCRLLVTGSEDATLFIFSIEFPKKYPNLRPIGFIKLPSAPTCMTWKPQTDQTIIIGCLEGDILEIQVPDVPKTRITVSYELKHCQTRGFKFQSEKKIRIAGNVEKNLQIERNQILTITCTNWNTIWITVGGFHAGYIYEYSRIEKTVEKNPEKIILISDNVQVDICNCLFFDNGRYLILGMENGEIRVCRMNSKDPSNLSDYMSLSVHDFARGKISKIIYSYNEEILYTCGHDGNLFSFIINNNAAIAKETAAEKVLKQTSLPELNVDDIDGYTHPSLEQVVNEAEENRILSEAKKKKNQTLKILQKLTDEYEKLMEQNKNLPESQRIAEDYFQLDPRITEDLNRQFKEEMDELHEKFAFNLEKSQLTLEKLTNQFIKPITCLPFGVSQILNPDIVTYSLEEKKLEDNFLEMYENVKQELNEQISQSRSSEQKSMLLDTNDDEIQPATDIEDFLKEFSPDMVHPKLNAQIEHLLKKYRDRKSKIVQRTKEWKKMNENMPNPNIDHPQDLEAIAEAERTIGDYKLKSSPTYNLFKPNRETTLEKYKQLLNCRRSTHYLREDFNERLRDVRNKKSTLQMEVIDLIEKLQKIQAEIPEMKIKPLPKIFEINHSLEYPEKNLKPETYIPTEEKNHEAGKNSVPSIERNFFPEMDEEYQVLLLDAEIIRESMETSLSTLNNDYQLHKAQINVPDAVMEALNTDNHVESGWEQELKLARLSKKLYEQDKIINYINTSYKAIDDHLEALEQQRISIEVDSTYSELYQLTLHQELIILNDSEAKESVLTEKVNEKLKSQDEYHNKIRRIRLKIDQKTTNIQLINEKIKELNSQFIGMISESIYSDYLKKIFKKKYKPARKSEETVTDSSSSSSSSSSSEDDDRSTIGSQNFGQLDENNRPPNCEEFLYNSAFAMRAKRYEYEQQIREEQKIVDNYRRDLDKVIKLSKQITGEYESAERELLEFKKKKQNELNDIDVTVILNLHQLQHFLERDNLAKINECVVFDKKTLMKLYARVGELQQETFDQKMKHKKNKLHFHRMEVDCNYMNSEIKTLKDEIKQEMFKKFGKEISLTSLYETVLKRMIYDINADSTNIIKLHDREINCIKNKYREQVEVLQNLIQDNTEKLSLLTVLEEEQAKLRKISKQIPESEETMQKIEEEYTEDLLKLEEILKTQRQQKQLFRSEIRNLRLKSRPQPPIYPRGRVQKIQNSPRDTKEIETLQCHEILINDDTCIYQMHNSNSETSTSTIIRRLLTKIIDLHFSTGGIDGSIDDILDEIISQIPTAISDIKSLRAEMEMAVKTVVHDEELRGIIVENLNDAISKLEVESRGVEAGSVKISWSLKPKIDELLDSMNIEKNTDTGISLMKLLNEEMGVEAAVDYLLALSLPSTAVGSADTEAALREHALRTLTDIKREIDAKNSDKHV